MLNYNKVLLAGNLTRDPELRYAASNLPVANFGLAVNRRYTAATGEKKEETLFIDCEAWGRTADTIKEYLAKGRAVLVEGRLKLDQWQDREGQNRSKIKVVVESFQFADSNRDHTAANHGEGKISGDTQEVLWPGTEKHAEAQAQNGRRPRQTVATALDDEDIPF